MKVCAARTERVLENSTRQQVSAQSARGLEVDNSTRDSLSQSGGSGVGRACQEVAAIPAFGTPARSSTRDGGGSEGGTRGKLDPALPCQSKAADRSARCFLPDLPDGESASAASDSRKIK